MIDKFLLNNNEDTPDSSIFKSKNKPVRIILCAIFVCLFSSCKNGESKNHLPAPKTVHYKGGTVAVYKYDGLAPFLTKNDGKLHIFNFWATWCKPCVEELPHFEKLYQTYKNKGVEVNLVSLDIPATVEQKLIPFIEREKLQTPVLLLDDPYQNDWIPKVDANWSGAIPATLFYKNGKSAFFEQSFTYEELEKQVVKFLNPQ